MRACSRCAATNADTAKFCSECGAPLQPAAPREQRKVVTVLFCDVSGSTSLGERLDPEALRVVMSRYFDTARAAVERHGGTVEKFIGDAVMAVFGIPAAHEDDALRAVRAAVELRDGAEIAVRIGVNTGAVVTGGPDTLATGDAVNVAARLEQAADTGEILLGAETYALVQEVVDAELLPPLQAKGKSQPVTAYRLRALTGDRKRRDAAPMLGRARELGLLEQAFERTVQETTCHLFTVLGTAGIGKSRLVTEFLRGLDGARVVQGRCLSYGEGITYWPVVEVVKQLPRLPEDESVRAPLAALLGESDTGTTPREIAWAVRKAFEHAALDAPLVVVFDDIQWGEATFLDLVEHVADLSRGVPIFLLCMARPELLDVRPGWGGGKHNASSVLLEPLARDFTESLARTLLGSDDAILTARIRDAADGNPLYVEEMVELARVSGGDVAVPPTIHALLAARLDSLPPEERAVLERGAVEGQVFHRNAVAALAPDERQVDSRLVALVRKELVRPDSPALPSDDAYRFRHLLIRDAAYEALPKAMRIELHERFASWLEVHGPDLVELDEIVGYHLEQAVHYAEELGQPAPQAVRAAERLAAAALRAEARADAQAARNLARRAAALFPSDDPRRFELMPVLGKAHYDLGDIEGSMKAFTEAVERGDALTSARARVARAWTHAHTSSTARHAEGLAEIDRGIAELERLGHRGALAAAHTARGRMLFWAGAIEDAHEAALLGRDLARAAGDVRAEADAVEELLISLDWSAAPRTTVERVARDVFADDRLGPRLQARAVISLARSAIATGRFGEAAPLIADACRRFDDLGLEMQSAAYAFVTFDLGCLSGDWPLAAEGARSAWDRLGALGEVGYRSTAGAALAWALVELGRTDEATEIVAEAERIASPDDQATTVLALIARSRIASSLGEHERAVALAQEAWDVISVTDDAGNQLFTLIGLAASLADAARFDEAAGVVERVVELAERRASPAFAERARTILAAAPQQ